MYSFLELLYTWKKFHVDKIFQNPLSILIFFFLLSVNHFITEIWKLSGNVYLLSSNFVFKSFRVCGTSRLRTTTIQLKVSPLFSLWIVDIQNQCPCYWSKFGQGSLQFVDIWSNPFYWKLVISMQNLGQGHILKMHNLL